MVRFGSYIIIAAVTVLVFASAMMNYIYVSTRVETEFYGYVMGAVSIAFDAFKSFAPLLIVAALANKKYFASLVGSIIFLGLVGFSVLSAFGFAAMNMNAASSGAQVVTEQYTDIKDDISRAKEKLDAQPQARAFSAVQQALMAHKQHKRWVSSKQCTEATARKSKAFCSGYFALKTELAIAKKREKIETKLSSLKAKKSALLNKGAKRDADPQAGLIAKLTGFQIKDVQTGIAGFIALLLEMVAAFGFYFATAHGLFGKQEEFFTAKENETAVLPVKTLDEVAKEATPVAPALALVTNEPRKIRTLTQDNIPAVSEVQEQTRPRRLTVGANGVLGVV